MPARRLCRDILILISLRTSLHGNFGALRGRHWGNTRTKAKKQVRTIRLNMVKVAFALRQESDVGSHHVPMPNIRVEIFEEPGPI